MELRGCLASNCTSCPPRAPTQACGIWPAKQHSFQNQSFGGWSGLRTIWKHGVPWHAGPLGLRRIWFPPGCASSDVEESSPRPRTWLGSRRWDRPLSSVRVLPPAGLAWGAHILFLLRGVFPFQPLTPRDESQLTHMLRSQDRRQHPPQAGEGGVSDLQFRGTVRR